MDARRRRETHRRRTEPLSSGTSRSASATALISSTAGSSRSVTGRSRVRARSQSSARAHRHRLGQVVVRDLALRARHRRGDGLAHRVGSKPPPVTRHRRGACRLRRARGLDIGERHRAVGAGSRHSASASTPRSAARLRAAGLTVRAGGTRRRRLPSPRVRAAAARCCRRGAPARAWATGAGAARGSACGADLREHRRRPAPSSPERQQGRRTTPSSKHLDLDRALLGLDDGDDVARSDRGRPASPAIRRACPPPCRRPATAS